LVRRSLQQRGANSFTDNCGLLGRNGADLFREFEKEIETCDQLRNKGRRAPVLAFPKTTSNFVAQMRNLDLELRCDLIKPRANPSNIGSHCLCVETGGRVFLALR
jgi:hypothetical protein